MGKNKNCEYNPAHDVGILREMYGLVPQDVNGQSNVAAFDYRQRIFRRIMSLVDFSGYPDGETDKIAWDVNFMKSTLFGNGYVAIINTAEYGVIPMRCTITGYNVFYQPNTVVVANPFLTARSEYTIGEDCVLMKLQYNYMGVWPIVNRFAQRFASIDAGIDVNIMNTKAAWMFDCDGSAQEQTARKIYSDITAGRPVVFTRVNNNPTLGSDGKVGINMLDVGKTFITDKLYDAYRETEYALLTELGINNSNVDKKERVNTLEVQANNDELRNSIDDWKFNIEAGCKAVREVFGIDLRASFPYYQNVSRETSDETREEGRDNVSSYTAPVYTEDF